MFNEWEKCLTHTKLAATTVCFLVFIQRCAYGYENWVPNWQTEDKPHQCTNTEYRTVLQKLFGTLVTINSVPTSEDEMRFLAGFVGGIPPALEPPLLPLQQHVYVVFDTRYSDPWLVMKPEEILISLHAPIKIKLEEYREACRKKKILKSVLYCGFLRKGETEQESKPDKFAFVISSIVENDGADVTPDSESSGAISTDESTDGEEERKESIDAKETPPTTKVKRSDEKARKILDKDEAKKEKIFGYNVDKRKELDAKTAKVYTHVTASQPKTRMKFPKPSIDKLKKKLNRTTGTGDATETTFLISADRNSKV